MKTPTLGAGVALLALAFVATGPAAYAAEGDLEVVNTETIQVYVSSEGDIESQRVYEQLTLTGTGSASVANPIEEEGLRNLNGFGGLTVEDGVQSLEVDVDGVARLRSVSDFTGELPLDISVQYRLDGEPVEPGDVVGADGVLEVLYTVKNVTARPQDVTFTDGSGGTVTETVDVPIPMVGSLSTVAPPNFTDVKSEQANLAGDGKGGTKLSFTMTLFPPLGSDTAEFGYTATISDGVVPPSTVSALPVNPLESTSFKTAGESYQAGSDTGERLADGATEIDANLLKLRDGAAKLLSGLIQLSDGADQLNAGLAGEAAPGAVLLADGAVVLKDGLGQIDDGAGLLADGAERLRAGSGDALSGSQQLENGLGLISGGLDQLAATDGLPAAGEGIDRLRAGMDLVIAGFGTTTQPDTLIGGLHALELGLGQAEAGTGLLAGGMDLLRGGAGALDDPLDGSGLAKAQNAVDIIQGGLDESLTAGGSLDQLVGGLNAIKTNFCATHPAKDACDGVVDQLIAGVEHPSEGSRVKLTQASSGLGAVSSGLGDAMATLTPLTLQQCGALPQPTLRCGLMSLAAGITQAKNGAGELKQGAQDLKAGLLEIDGGLGQLQAGITSAVDGVLELSAGANDAYAGSGDLTDGLGLIAGGAGELSDGANRLADGTGDASDGSQQLADGAGELADGLGDAADGSSRLADGMADAAEGAPKLVDGAGRLSEEGMSQLIGAGQDTAQDYGKLYATIEAGAERADAERMAYGAPEGAMGATAYTYELLGDDGEGSRNTKRGLAALVLLALAGGAFLLRRRLV